MYAEGVEGCEDLDKNLTEGHASKLTELPLRSIIYFWCTEAYPVIWRLDNKVFWCTAFSRYHYLYSGFMTW